MKVKLFEVRDRCTFVAVMCIKMNSPTVHKEEYLLRRAGYSLDNDLIAMWNMRDGDPCRYEFYNSRTYEVSHEYISLNWDSLKSGDVVDVEYILGETKTCKVSEELG